MTIVAALLVLLPLAVSAGPGREKGAAGEQVVTVFAGSKDAADNT